MPSKAAMNEAARAAASLEGCAVGTCDWGHCDNPSVMLRWSPTYGGWLSVCGSHARSGRPPAESLRPLIDDPRWEEP